MKSMLLMIVIMTVSNNCFAGCFEHHQSYPVVVQQFPVVQQIRVIQPVMVQQMRMVPVVESRLEYRTLDSYYLNYGHYYYQPQFVPNYNYRYVADPWQGYNY